ncbi:MAG: hypothetical protein JWR75_247 [Devosia sp.]|nr:hypothetical protein [Devosia sp.]
MPTGDDELKAVALAINPLVAAASHPTPRAKTVAIMSHQIAQAAIAALDAHRTIPQISSWFETVAASPDPVLGRMPLSLLMDAATRINDWGDAESPAVDLAVELFDLFDATVRP